jgi:hypothetical protein
MKAMYTLPVLNGCSTIQLTRKKNCLVDSGDYPEFSRAKWHAHRSYCHFYAVRRPRINGRAQYIRMHRLVLTAPSDVEVDHRSGDSLDNTRSNLRLATRQQNQQNRRKRAGTSSKYRGVSFYTQTQRWRAAIRDTGGRDCHLGYFSTETEAAHAYNRAAKELFGGFARLNALPRGWGAAQ